MPEEVETPLGRETVLKAEELEEQIGSRNMSKYLKQDDGTYKCRDCGATIMAAQVAHPIWDGPFPMSGSGRCHYEEVPYCPKCEPEPNLHGSPITPKGSYHNP